MIEIDTVFPSVKVDGKEIRFTKTEFKLFVFMYENRNKILTHNNIIDHVWGYDTYITNSAFCVAMNGIRRRLVKTSLKESIETIRGFGYRFCYHERELFVVSERMGDICLVGNHPESVSMEEIN